MNIDAIIELSTETFKRKLKENREDLNFEELTVASAERFTKVLKEGLAEAGKEALRAFVEKYDEPEGEKLEKDGRSYSWKTLSEKEFLTPFGHVKIKRNLYQANEGGKCYVPLDERWGMVGEFATIEVREAILYSLAHLTPKEIENHLKKLAWFEASETAIKNVGEEMGYFMEYRKEEIYDFIRNGEEVPKETKAFVASMDGVNVLLNEPGVKKGRPTERPQKKEEDSKSSYKNAMVGSFSFYGKIPEDEKSPERLTSRYVSRMPEGGFGKFKKMFENELDNIGSNLSGDIEKVVLCDGSLGFWNYIDETPTYNDYEKMLDFYHSTEHLSNAAEAIFGKKSKQGDVWFQMWRKNLLVDDNGAENLLQSLHDHETGLPASRLKILNEEITFFQRNKHRMTYADFLRRGLPIGSGPVEAACKTIVKHRLCRSGMRWSIRGGQRILYLRCYVLSNCWDSFWYAYKTFKFASGNSGVLP